MKVNICVPTWCSGKSASHWNAVWLMQKRMSLVWMNCCGALSLAFMLYYLENVYFFMVVWFSCLWMLSSSVTAVLTLYTVALMLVSLFVLIFILKLIPVLIDPVIHVLIKRYKHFHSQKNTRKKMTCQSFSFIYFSDPFKI